MIITIDKIKQRIAEGKLTLPGITKHNVHSMQKIQSGQGITALHCAYSADVTDKTEVLADNIYKLYINNNNNKE